MVEDPEAIRAEQSLLMERVHGELRSERIIQLEERLEEQAKLFPRLLQLEAAVQEGATLVRVGTDIFGARNRP